MTHLYTLLVGGTVIPGDGPEVEAIAWADDTILTLGSESDVRAISRGDSDIVELDGEFVIPVGPDGPTWPSGAMLEVGGPADLAVVERDPRRFESAGASVDTVAVIRGGHLVSGALPGLDLLDPDSGHP